MSCSLVPRIMSSFTKYSTQKQDQREGYGELVTVALSIALYIDADLHLSYENPENPLSWLSGGVFKNHSSRNWFFIADFLRMSKKQTILFDLGRIKMLI